MPELFSWQEPHCDALERSLEFHNVALDASDLGTGKTICACETARRLGKELIVVGKKIMKPVWAYWMDQWGIDGVVGNWEMARKRGLPRRDNALYVFDEVHEAGGYKTLNAKLLIGIYEAGLPLLMLSATAIESPLKMWALGYILGFHNLKDFYRWSFKFGVKRNFGYPGFHFDGSPSALNRIHAHIFPEWGGRMRKSLIPEFPECQTMLQPIEPAEVPNMPGLTRWWKEIEAKEAAHEEKMADFAETSSNPAAFGQMQMLPEMLFMRMRAELLKVPSLIELAQEAVDQNYSVVIFVNFLTTLRALETLGFEKALVIEGGQKMDERQYAIACFQSNQIKVLISTIDSGGAGISLHDTDGNHPRMALICPTWRAVTFRQSLGRVHRAGGKSKAIQKLVYAAGTIEETVADRVRGKLNQIDLINDADLAEAEFAPA
jgi:hypothetical protein